MRSERCQDISRKKGKIFLHPSRQRCFGETIPEPRSVAGTLVMGVLPPSSGIIRGGNGAVKPETQGFSPESPSNQDRNSRPERDRLSSARESRVAQSECCAASRTRP